VLDWSGIGWIREVLLYLALGVPYSIAVLFEELWSHGDTRQVMKSQLKVTILLFQGESYQLLKKKN